MFVEPVRIVADALRHATYGVNARLPLVPVDPGDPAPPLLPAGGILDETTNGLVAADRLPADLVRCLAVSLFPGAVQPDSAVASEGQGLLTVLIRYGTKHKDPHVALRDAGYTLRGVLKVLQWLHGGSAPADAMTKRNQVQLIRQERLEIAAMYEPIGDHILTGAVRAVYEVRDYWNGL